MVCSDDCSRYDVATEIVSILNRTGKIKINKVKSDFFKKEYFAPRPSSEKLINTKLQLRDINVMGEWKARLKEYVISAYK